LLDFNENRISRQIIKNITNVKYSKMKIRPVRSGLFHEERQTDGRTDRQTY